MTRKGAPGNVIELKSCIQEDKVFKEKPDAKWSEGSVDLRVISYQWKLTTGCVTSPREGSVMQSARLRGVEHLKSALRSNMEIQSLEFAQLSFQLVKKN